MGDVINLTRYRKARAKLSGKRRSAENQARFGRNRRERDESRHTEERRERKLDGKRLDHDCSADEPPIVS